MTTTDSTKSTDSGLRLSVVRSTLGDCTLVGVTSTAANLTAARGEDHRDPAGKPGTKRVTAAITAPSSATGKVRVKAQGSVLGTAKVKKGKASFRLPQGNGACARSRSSTWATTSCGR